MPAEMRVPSSFRTSKNPDDRRPKMKPSSPWQATLSKRRKLLTSKGAFEDRELVNLPVVPACLLLEEEFAEPFGTKIAADAESICTMRLGNAVPDPYVLGSITVSVVHFQLRMRRLQAVQYLPAHNAHEGFRTERLPALGL